MADENPPPTFEESFARAEKAVESLERGDLPLDDCLKEYEQGFRALRRCYEILEQAQKRIEVLAGPPGGGSAPGEASSPLFWKLASAIQPLGEALERIAREGATSTSHPIDPLGTV